MKKVSSNDQIGRGGCIKVCPVGQIGRGGELKSAHMHGEPETTTPKRKFSPVDDSPMGRVRKMSTTVEASPRLRSRLVPHQIIQVPTIEAPDLIQGIGRLKLRGSNIAVAPQNIVRKLMGQTRGQRTPSFNGEIKGKRKKATHMRSSTQSLTSQKRNDTIFSPRSQKTKETVVPKSLSQEKSPSE